MLYLLLYPLSDRFAAFNVLRYPSFRMLMAGLTSLVIGLFPVVGVPLPFFSYGGTSMVTSMVGVGILLNISMRRFMF